jgi:predicted anti-sigma-YlaC factor YlaD
VNCRELRAAVEAVLSASAGDAEKWSVETHLGSCPRCREAYGELLRLGDLVRGLGWRAVPAGFDQRFAATFAARRAAAPSATRSPWVERATHLVRPGWAAVVVAVGSMAVLGALVPEPAVGRGAIDFGRLGATVGAGFFLAAIVQGVRRSVDLRMLVTLRGRSEGGLV